MIPEPTEDDLKMDLEAEYALSDRDAMRRALIRLASGAPGATNSLVQRVYNAVVDQAKRVEGTDYLRHVERWVESVESGTLVAASSAGGIGRIPTRVGPNARTFVVKRCICIGRYPTVNGGTCSHCGGITP